MSHMSQTCGCDALRGIVCQAHTGYTVTMNAQSMPTEPRTLREMAEQVAGEFFPDPQSYMYSALLDRILVVSDAATAAERQRCAEIAREEERRQRDLAKEVALRHSLFAQCAEGVAEAIEREP